MSLGPLLSRGKDFPGVGEKHDPFPGAEGSHVELLLVLLRHGPTVVVLVAFWVKVDLHLSAPQGSQVLVDVGLADVVPGYQEPDHERGVEDLAEPECLRDVERNTHIVPARTSRSSRASSRSLGGPWKVSLTSS